ncbi:MAG: helix-turn-helix domain-containing protein, partial [Firmicutes bacterium]|nr:helix-turn-helix domain-containing protein [Bacillota bacterium]
LLGLGNKQTSQMVRYYNNIPVIPESSRLFTVIDAFCDVIWEGEASSYVTINKNEDLPFSSISTPEFEERPELDMEMMERRYEFENQIIDAVKHGQAYKSELFITALAPAMFEQRLSDSVRNSKNYMIIMNTLLRKAAESGGVHPFYLDKISSGYAAEIEAIKNVKTLPYFMKKLFEDYCRLVNKHATRNYSTLIKNVIIYIDARLSEELSLKKIAEMNGVSSTYLSTCFKQETGKNFVDYVNGKRVEQAKHMLKTTRLQIQTVAQHCGFLDVQYFAKVFKKYTGKTPREYRDLNSGK